MRILYVAPLGSIHSKRWISYFARAGHDVHVIDASFDDALEVADVKVHHLPLRGTRLPIAKYLLRFPRWLASWRRLIKVINPDVIHIHWLGLYALGAALSTGSNALVVTPWGSDLLVNPRESVKWRLQVRRILAAGSSFICDAEHLRDELLHRGIPFERIHVIAFGTDVNRFEPKQRDPKLAGELGFQDEAPLVISMRALDPIYDIGTLLAAIPTVTQSVPKTRFVIVGDGPQRSELEQLADSLGVTSLVRFVGRLSDKDMVRYAASASVYVSTSLSDGGLAASTAEAMACGVPPVVTDFGDNASWVNHGVTGFLFPCSDAATLSARLIEVLSDQDLARRLGVGARHTIVERNNVDTEMQKVEEIYRSLSRRDRQSTELRNPK